ncbi:dimeric dUTPase [Synechococcus phage BUCT-ZZ01]|nr:dimeric dUTPase [Synechococcus phage BUCT-ZZ01]
MDFRKAIRSSFDLQNTMNSLVDADWISRKRNWPLAMQVELFEAVGHVGFKWWKKETPNWDQAFIELVDTYHFMLSHIIELNAQVRENEQMMKGIGNTDPQEVFVDAVADMMEKSYDFFKDKQEYILNEKEVVLTLQDAATDILDMEKLVQSLVILTHMMGKNPEEFLKMYIAKNVLNIFRQNNGYKTGEYIKIWEGKEDNEYLQEAINTNPALVDDSNGLYSVLEAGYCRVKP